jgi:hypothetical protein
MAQSDTRNHLDRIGGQPLWIGAVSIGVAAFVTWAIVPLWRATSYTDAHIVQAIALAIVWAGAVAWIAQKYRLASVLFAVMAAPLLVGAMAYFDVFLGVGSLMTGFAAAVIGVRQERSRRS